MNRTSRDLLLSRHAGAVSRLDELRGAAVAGERPVPARELLSALFLPQRRLWLGLAAAWIVLLALNLFQPARPAVDSRTLDQAVRLYATNRTQLHALLATTSSLP